MDRFGVAKADWKPYWKTPVATADSPAVKISAWTRKKSALLFVSHVVRKNETARVAVPGDKVKVIDALTGSPIDTTNGVVTLDFHGMNYRLLEVHGVTFN